MAFSCIVVDDDLFAVKQLEEYILKIPALGLVNSFTDPVLAAKNIAALQQPIDFLFTDIEMPNLSGLELAKMVQQQVKNLILVSGYPKYALDGYQANARDFLTKPFNFTQFEQLINWHVNRLNLESPFIWIKSGKKSSTKVYLNDIIVIKANGNYIQVHTLTNVLVMYHKLIEIEEMLKYDPVFKRVSRFFIISTKHVEKINGNVLELKKGLVVTISESFRNSFKLTEKTDSTV